MASPAGTVEVGQRVVWLYEPRGGYGYTQRVHGTVVHVGRKRVTIRVERNDGEFVERHVSPQRLLPATPPAPEAK